MVIAASVAVIALVVLVGVTTRTCVTGIVRMEPVSKWWLAQQRHEDFVKNC